MVSDPERIFLIGFIDMHMAGPGEFVEIGTFCGGSAIAILRGMEKAGLEGRKLHVFDTFKFPTNDLEAVFRHMVPHCKGESFREEFDRQTAPYYDRLAVFEGDAAQHCWTGGPIRFLHIDCSISREFHEAVAREFYPHLVPGSVIAHQDYLYDRAPFIPEMMTKLEPWFESMIQVITTQYFRCTKTPSRAELEAAFAPAQALAA